MFRRSSARGVVFSPAYPELEEFASRCFLPQHPLRHSPIWLDENDFAFNHKAFARLQAPSPLQIDSSAHDKTLSPYSPTSFHQRRRAAGPTDSSTEKPPNATLPGQTFTGTHPTTTSTTQQDTPSSTGRDRPYRYSRSKPSPFVPICAMRVTYPLLLLNAEQVELSDLGYGGGAAQKLRLHVAKLLHMKSGPGASLHGYREGGEPSSSRQSGGAPQLIEEEMEAAGERWTGFGSSGRWGRAAFHSSPGVSSFFPAECSGVLNAASGKPYMDPSVVDALQKIKLREGYASPWWATIQQWKSIGAYVSQKRFSSLHRVSYTKLTKLVHISLIVNGLEVLHHANISLHKRLFRCTLPPHTEYLEGLMGQYLSFPSGEEEKPQDRMPDQDLLRLSNFFTQLPKERRTDFACFRDMHRRRGLIRSLQEQLKAEQQMAKNEPAKMGNRRKKTSNTSAKKKERVERTKMNPLPLCSSDDSSTNGSQFSSYRVSSFVESPVAKELRQAISEFIPLFYTSKYIQMHQLELKPDARPVATELAEALLPDAMEVLEAKESPITPAYHSRAARNSAKEEVRYLYHISELSTPSGALLEPPPEVMQAILRRSSSQAVHGVTGAPLPYVELELEALQQRHRKVAAHLRQSLEIAAKEALANLPAAAASDADVTGTASTSSAELLTTASSPSSTVTNDTPTAVVLDGVGSVTMWPAAVEEDATPVGGEAVPLAQRSIWFHAEDVLHLGGVVDVNASPVEVKPHSEVNVERARQRLEEEVQTAKAREKAAAVDSAMAVKVITNEESDTSRGLGSLAQSGNGATRSAANWSHDGGSEFDAPSLYHVSALADMNEFLAQR